MQQEQRREQYELFNLTRKETAKNRKLLKKLYGKLLQLNTSSPVLSRETIVLTYDTNFILIMLQLRERIAVL